jgi:hypothetical protein
MDGETLMLVYHATSTRVCVADSLHVSSRTKRWSISRLYSEQYYICLIEGRTAICFMARVISINVGSYFSGG